MVNQASDLSILSLRRVLSVQSALQRLFLKKKKKKRRYYLTLCNSSHTGWEFDFHAVLEEMGEDCWQISTFLLWGIPV